jgi:hypothetical protein
MESERGGSGCSCVPEGHSPPPRFAVQLENLLKTHFAVTESRS